MALEKRNRKTNGILWAGLAMIGAALVLTFVTSLYAGRAGGYSSPAEMMGQGYGAPVWGAQGDVGSLPAAHDVAEGALKSYGNPDLGATEVMEFSNNYYAEVREKDTHTGAMELLVDKGSGQVYPEPGPNMMWNTKYGMMGGYSTTSPDEKMTIAPERAAEIANDYLARVSPGTK